MAEAAETQPKTNRKQKPTDEEIEAKRKERAEKKERKAREEREKEAQMGVNGSTIIKAKDGSIPFAVRKWSKVKGVAEEKGKRKIKLISWNILAQGLVRRKLFPGSDCLKWKDRELGLTSEMLSIDWDLATFQEVDKIEVHGENLRKSGRNYVYAKGYNDKQHGLMVSWRIQQKDNNHDDTALFEEEPVASKVIFFDRENVDATANEGGSRLGLSRVTRNIALFVALRFKGNENEGIIIATTHLFWHPMHAYERVRQMGLMKRRLQIWKEEHAKEWNDWPIFVSGDFNEQPHSATYKLASGQPITQHCLDEVEQSTVVHQSVDELRKKVEQDTQTTSLEEAIVENGNAAQQDASGPGNEEEEDEENGGKIDEEEGEDDQVLKNCRLAKVEDGLLSFDELVQLYDLSKPPPSSKGGQTKSNGDANKKWLDYHIPVGLQSLYGMNFNNLESDQEGNYFSSPNRWRERHDDPNWSPSNDNPHLHLGSFEPMYTLYSALFCLTLDYIFFFPPSSNTDSDKHTTSPTVIALLPTHSTEILKPGIPRKNVCASDHILIGAEVAI